MQGLGSLCPTYHALELIFCSYRIKSQTESCCQFRNPCVGAGSTHLPDSLQQTFISLVLESGKCNIKVLPDYVSGKGTLSDLQRATFSLCLHLVERENFGLFLFL